MVMRYRGRNVFIVAHRGGSSSFENSMSSFLRAQELGVDAVECDVHSTKDGKIVISHDPDLKRVANVDAKIIDMEYRDIANIRLPNGEKIPLLEELFNLINIPVVIEIKSGDVVAPLISLFSEKPELVSKCIILSFFHDTVRIIKESIPEINCGVLLAGFPVNAARVARDAGCEMISLYHEGINPAYVKKCHEGGVMVSVWAPNSYADIKNSLDAGVDAIGSDKPEEVMKIINSYGKGEDVH